MNYKGLLALLILVLGIQSCSDNSRPNYQYFPNMYEQVGYETYADSDAFANGIEAQIPVEGSIARGWEPYDYPDTNEGYEAAKANLNYTIEITDANQANGKELYSIYCAVCHGNKGDGQGILMTREKFLGVPSYADKSMS